MLTSIAVYPNCSRVYGILSEALHVRAQLLQQSWEAVVGHRSRYHFRMASIVGPKPSHLLILESVNAQQQVSFAEAQASSIDAPEPRQSGSDRTWVDLHLLLPWWVGECTFEPK